MDGSLVHSASATTGVLVAALVFLATTIPLGCVVIGKAGPRRIAGPLVQHFLFFVIVAVLAAYVAGISGLKDGAPFFKVFRIVSTVSTMAFVLGAAPQSIWFARPWKSWMLQCIDGLACGLTTGAGFGWLWPL